MGSIRILDPHLANQIAAGEVVERPASVVKELVENAIDAGSRRIDVMLEEGGLQLIRIRDDGKGMERDDLELAFLRHATSKITSVRDLFHIRTLGFRGEALPSIAAVSKVTCVTATDDDGSAWRLVIEGGERKLIEQTSANRGTDFAVRELFYNTPARLKYMKTVQTELSHISDYLIRLSLAYPHLSFVLTHNGHQLFQTAGKGDLLQTIAAVYGTAMAKAMVSFEAENADFRVSGFMARPETTRSNRNGITTIVNGRYIRNFSLIQSFVQGYHTLLPVARFPVGVLHLQMNPELLDVNVHPAKLEVRFSKEQELLALIEQTVRERWRFERLIPEMRSEHARRDQDGFVSQSILQEQLPLFQPPEQKKHTLSESGNNEQLRSEQPVVPPRASVSRHEKVISRETKSQMIPVHEGEQLLAPPLVPPPAPPAFPELHVIGQLHGTYIVAQNNDGLYLVDQHAAHERIHYEAIMQKLATTEQAVQPLLVPIQLELDPIEAQRLDDRLALLEQVGLRLQPFGGRTYRVSAYPHWIPAGDENELVQELITYVLGERKVPDMGKLREKSAIMAACKASIRANERLTNQELTGLLHQLAVCRNPYTCPHGRPIVISFSTHELEKMFKRVM